LFKAINYFEQSFFILCNNKDQIRLAGGYLLLNWYLLWNTRRKIIICW